MCVCVCVCIWFKACLFIGDGKHCWNFLRSFSNKLQAQIYVGSHRTSHTQWTRLFLAWLIEDSCPSQPKLGALSGVYCSHGLCSLRMNVILPISVLLVQTPLNQGAFSWDLRQLILALPIGTLANTLLFFDSTFPSPSFLLFIPSSESE